MIGRFLESEAVGLLTYNSVDPKAGEAIWKVTAVNVLRATLRSDPHRHVVLKDHDKAIRLLKEYLTANPGHVTQLSDLGWWWRDLRDDPRFQEMIASAKQVR